MSMGFLVGLLGVVIRARPRSESDRGVGSMNSPSWNPTSDGLRDENASVGPLSLELAFLAATQRQVERQQDVQAVQGLFVVRAAQGTPEQVAQQIEIARLGRGIFGIGGLDPLFVDLSRDRLVVRVRRPAGLPNPLVGSLEKFVHGTSGSCLVRHVRSPFGRPGSGIDVRDQRYTIWWS